MEIRRPRRCVNKEDKSHCVAEEITTYTTYKIVETTTPVFSCQPDAIYGKQGVRMTERQDYYVLTSAGTVAPGANATVVFDLGEGVVETTRITYNGIVAAGSYPALRLVDLYGSPDSETWTLISSAIGGRGTNDIAMPTPNNFRYIRFYVYNDDPRFGGCGVNNFKIHFKKRVPVDRTTTSPLSSMKYDKETRRRLVCYAELKPFVWVPDLHTEWIQPVFTAPTLWSTDNYYTISASRTDGSYYPYKSFNGDKTTGDSTWWTGDMGALTENNAPWIMLQSRVKPLYLTGVDILNESVSPWNYSQGEVQVSDDGVMWKTVAQLSDGVDAPVTVSTTWNIDKPYFYYRLRFTKGFKNGITAQDITFKGFETKQELIKE